MTSLLRSLHPRLAKLMEHRAPRPARRRWCSALLVCQLAVGSETCARAADRAPRTDADLVDTRAAKRNRYWIADLYNPGWAELSMSKHRREIAARGPVWAWLVNNGPHGSSFQWGQTPQAPKAFRDLDLLREIVEERTAADPFFSFGARSAALELLIEEEADYVRRAIQVLSVVASTEDADALRKLLRHRSADVRKDAQACLFELGVQV
jgi:hypothetical protein